MCTEAEEGKICWLGAKGNEETMEVGRSVGGKEEGWVAERGEIS
jgi:hypothetical protein